MVSPGSNSSSWGSPDGAPPSQAGKRSKESLSIQRIYKFWIVSPVGNSSSWGLQIAILLLLQSLGGLVKQFFFFSSLQEVW